MSSNRITMKRLQKEEHGLEKQPIPGVWVKRQGFLNFYFCIHGLDGAYSGGYYFGLLELHENYPFAAPKLFFYTKSGRFEINMPICTSFTHYHQETWTSAWNVRTLILATISFMTSNQPSYGCRDDPASIKKQYARKSLADNMSMPKFVELFKEQLQLLNANGHNYVKQKQIIEEQKGQELKLNEGIQKFEEIDLIEQKVQDGEKKVDEGFEINLQEEILRNEQIPDRPIPAENQIIKKIIITGAVSLFVVGLASIGYYYVLK